MSSTCEFGINLGGGGTAAAVWTAAQRAEAAGFDSVTVADHLGAAAPFQQLAVAAAATERVSLRTYVLDAYFWNPALLAREVATLDELSGGRAVLGVGAGHMRHEHETAGLSFPGIRERWAHVETLVAEVRRHLGDPDHQPSPVQRPVPVMVAGMGQAGLEVAARTADVVGITGMVQVPGRPAGTFTMASNELVHERIADVRERATAAGRPAPMFDALIQQVRIDAEPERAAREWVAKAGARGATWFRVENLLASPFFLFAASPKDAATELARRCERFGILSWSAHAASSEAMEQVVAASAARR